jgi:thiol-disulfide isomerase/thioredoxin
MIKKSAGLIIIILIGLSIIAPFFTYAESQLEINPPKVEVNFFYSETCPHCKAENTFLDQIASDYPDVIINRYLTTDSEHRQLLIDLLKKHNADKYLGLVPLTFVGEDFIPGFDNDEGIGKQIINSIENQLKSEKPTEKDKNKINLPILGEIDLSKYSLLMQAIILGFFDGFNVCSLGALVMILGLVLILKSRPRIILFGGLYIFATAIIYGLLIFLWYQLFYYLSPVLKIMNVIVGILGILGAIYFLKQFLKARKQDLICDSQGNKIVNKQSLKIQEAFKKSGGIWGIIIGIIIFASIITIVEFPCSAVVPVLFAGVMAKAGLSLSTYILYLLIYILFYMLDEVIVFLIAVFTMNIKIASGKAMKWLNLIEAIVLLAMGFYYLSGIF